MVLARYSEKFWFPSGALAPGVAARVFPIDSNILAPIWADAAGTVPAPNPLLTDAAGFLTFWAEEGPYWIHIDTESFRVSIGTPALDVAEIASATISTGITAGGDISVNAISSSAIDIAPLAGYITNFSVDPFNPTITRISYPGGTVEMDAGSLARTVTWWLMDSGQNIIQVGMPPTNTEMRQFLFLGATSQEAGVIFIDQSLPVILQQPANQLADLMESLGPFLISGSTLSPNGVNLMIDQTIGTMFARAFHHFVGPVQTNDPHVSPTLSQAPAQFRYITQSAMTFGPLRNTLDVANFDSGGVVTPIGGGANSSTVHHVRLFPTNLAQNQLAIQYGQQVYGSLSAAVAGIETDTFIPNPIFRTNGAIIAYIAATRTATDLSDPTQATFVPASKFDIP